MLSEKKQNKCNLVFHFCTRYEHEAKKRTSFSFTGNKIYTIYTIGNIIHNTICNMIYTIQGVICRTRKTCSHKNK